MLPAPTAPSEGYAGVRSTLDPAPVNRLVTPLLDPGSPAQASLSHRTAPSCEEPDRSTRLRGPKVRWSFDLSGLASGTEVPRQPKPSDVLRPFLGRPLLRPASLTKLPRGESGSRVALEKINSSGASSRLAPVRTRKLFPMPAGGDRTFGHLPHPLAVAGSWRGRDRRPDHLSSPCTLVPSRKSEKCAFDPVDNVDIGHNRRNLFAIPPNRRRHRLPFRSPPPTSAKCLNRLP